MAKCEKVSFRIYKVVWTHIRDMRGLYDKLGNGSSNIVVTVPNVSEPYECV